MRNGITITILVLIMFLLIAGIIFVLPPRALAQTSPDTLDIHTCSVSRNLYQEGDMLFTCLYEIAWDSDSDYWDAPVDDRFLIQLIDTTTSTTYGVVQPYPFFNNGYDKGVASLYFDADQTAIIGLEWNTNYIMRITTKLGVLTPSEYYNYTLSDVDYCPSEAQDTNRGWLAEWIIDASQELETNWGVSSGLTSVSIQTVLSEDGERYFLRAIPGLRMLCPDLFIASILCPDTVNEGSYVYVAVIGDRSEYDSTFIENALESLDDLGGATIWLNVFAILLIGGLIAGSFTLFSTARPGLLLGLCTLPIGAALKFTELVVVGFVAILYILFIGKVLFYDKS